MTDYHVHTNFCDGKDSPSEVAAEAYKRGFEVLGFSAHSYVNFDTYCIDRKNIETYKSEISHLKEQYHGKMEIYCGIEQDLFSTTKTADYDYVIGSVHYIKSGGKYYPVDATPELVCDFVSELFGGDFDAYAEEYFRLEEQVVETTNADIIGHFDLLTKFPEINKKYGERYNIAAKKAIKKLVKYGNPFEINVGAITRGYRTLPYPALDLLEEIKKQGGSIIITGDCHNKEFLGCYLDLAKAQALKAGFKEQIILKNGKFITVPL